MNTLKENAVIIFTLIFSLISHSLIIANIPRFSPPEPETILIVELLKPAPKQKEKLTEDIKPLPVPIPPKEEVKPEPVKKNTP